MFISRTLATPYNCFCENCIFLTLSFDFSTTHYPFSIRLTVYFPCLPVKFNEFLCDFIIGFSEKSSQLESSLVVATFVCVFFLCFLYYSFQFHLDVGKKPWVAKVVWSYLPFVSGTSFRNGGMPLNNNIFFYK
jgi:hypothetical protein